MTELTDTTQALAVIRGAVNADIRSVTEAIDTAVTDIDRQLADLSARRDALALALDAASGELADLQARRDTIAELGARMPDGGEAPADPPPSAQARKGSDDRVAAAPVSEPPAADDDDEAWYTGLEDAIGPLDRPRTERLIAILDYVDGSMTTADLVEYLNAHGDDTTAKVVGSTLTNLVGRNAIRKIGPGEYEAV